jgi:hypothetical protein
VQCLFGNVAAMIFECPLDGPYTVSAASVRCPGPGMCLGMVKYYKLYLAGGFANTKNRTK